MADFPCSRRKIESACSEHMGAQKLREGRSGRGMLNREGFHTGGVTEEFSTRENAEQITHNSTSATLKIKIQNQIFLI